LEVEVSKYEGPTGILGVIADACLRRGIDALSLWAAIPHYASNSPSPKATLALINSLEDFLSLSIPQEPLLDESLEWELEVSELAREDSEVSEYVKALEESKDATGLPEATGESIARELERFLRRQNEK
jgi:predicted ATP-grasp superfamily ATP-dependent carboligase